MKKLIVQEFVSLDGFAADRDKTTGFFDGTYHKLAPDVDEHQAKFTKEVDLILLGTNTYKMFTAYWPTASEENSDITRAMNNIPKKVFSTSLSSVEWGDKGNIELVAENAEAHITALKNKGDQTIVIWGSLALARSLLTAGLVDEIQLVVAPVAIGQGYRFFPDSPGLFPFVLTHQQTFSDGTVLLVYKPSNKKS